jgi:hypothetical protein
MPTNFVQVFNEKTTASRFSPIFRKLKVNLETNK